MEKQDKLKHAFSFLETLRDAVFTIDEGYIVTSWNKATSELYHVSANEAVGRHLGDILSLEDSGATLEGMKEEVINNGLWSGTVFNKTTNSDRYHVNWNATSYFPENMPFQIVVSASKNPQNSGEQNTRKPAPYIWQSIIESIPGLVMMLDSDFRIEFLNKDVEKYWKTKIIGKPLIDFIEKDYKQAVLNTLETALVNNNGSKLQLPVTRKTGEVVWYDCNVVKTYPDGSGKEITIMATDITLQKQAESELRKNETLFRSIFEGSVYGMVATDLQGKIIKSNESFEKMTGYTEAELQDKNILELVKQEDIGKIEEKIADLIRNDQNYINFEYRLLDKKNDYLWTELTIFVVEDDSKSYRFLIALVKNITRYKETESEKRTLQEKYLELFETIRNGVVIYSPVDDGNDFIIKDFNRAAEAIENVSRRNVIGRKVTEVFPGVQDFGILDVFKKVYKTGETINHPVREYKDSRITGWRENIIYRLSNRDVVAVYDDITEHKQYEHQLKENEEIFRAVFETAVDAIFIKDKDRRYVRVNPSMLEIFNLSLDEIIGRTDDELFSFEQVKQEYEDDLKVLDGEILVGKTSRYLQGSLHSFHTVKVPILNEAGSVIGLCGIARDTTKHIENQKELQKEREKFRSLAENSTDYIIRFDNKARHIYVNPAAEKSYGVNSRILGKTHREIGVDEFLCHLWEQFINKVFDTGKVVEEVVEFIHQGEKKWLDWRLIPEYDSSGHIATVLAISRDITPLKHAESEKSLLEEQLRQSQKMEAIGKLAGGVAHDFNNLLTTITGNVSLARLETESGDAVNEMLDEISQASDRAADLTRQLLAFSRKQIIEPKVIQLNKMITGLHKMLVRIIGEDVKLETKPAKNLGNIKADPGQIEQIIVNLAVNARDAMPGGGKLVIETCNVELDEEYNNLHPYSANGDNVMLAVSDTGHGMDSETSRHIFDPFFTTKEKGQGTGLGLSTVYGIVKQHNGSIEVYSEPGNGTTFKIYFPQISEKADDTGKKNKQNKMPIGSETILVVEDEYVVRVMVSKVLNRLGYKIYSASSGKEAVEIYKSRKDEISLLLTDVIMPNMNGWELANRLHEITPDLKVLFTSGYTDNVIAQHGVLDEGVNFIGKPYSPVSIAQKVRHVLDDTEEQP